MSITAWPVCSRSGAPTAIFRWSRRTRSRSATCCCNTTTCSTGRAGSAQLNNYTWPQWVSTIKPPEGDELAKGTYRPLLAPVNFLQSKKGTQYFTIWYSGPLSIRNERGRFEFIPSNLQRFTALPGGTGKDVPADPALPDYKRDVQFTVNGQFQPVIKSKAGQTEIWVLANVSDIAYMPVQLTETATGNHPKIAIVGQDGIPYPEVHHPIFENGTRCSFRRPRAMPSP